jgi:hypothetical protein
MRGRPSLLGIAAACVTCAAVPLLAFGVSCSQEADGPRAASSSTINLAPTILLPQGITGVTNYQLKVFAGALTDSGMVAQCNPMTGALIDNILETPLFTGSDSQGSMCGGGDAHCFVGVKIPDGLVPRVYYVTGYSKLPQIPANLLAQGCGQDFLPPMEAGATASINIQMFPVQGTCGDGVLQPPETCDQPSDGGAMGECNSMCQTPEELLSAGSGPKGSLTLTGVAGDKSDPSFVWPLAGSFFGVFGDSSSGQSHLSVEPLSVSLSPTNAFGAVAENDSVYLPSTPGASLPDPPPSGIQKQPAAVDAAGTLYVAYTNQSSTGSPSTIELRSFDEGTLSAQQASPCLISESGGDSGVTGNMSAPAIAVTSSPTTNTPILLVAWQDDSGHVYARPFMPGTGCGTLGAQELLSLPGSTNNKAVALAGLNGANKGWVAVWTSGSDMVVRAVGSGGFPSPPVDAGGHAGLTTLNAPGHTATAPTIAAIQGDGVSNASLGAFAIAWSDTGPGGAATIYAQRYTPSGGSIEGPTQISATGDPSAVTPVIAASPALTGSYVVVWSDATGGSAPSQVRARLLQAGTASGAAPLSSPSAYLHNAIDGTTGEFIVSVASGRVRVSPTVVAGGGTTGASGGLVPYMAFGWVDNSSSGVTGVIARRFPLPTQ